MNQAIFLLKDDKFLGWTGEQGDQMDRVGLIQM